MTLPAFAAERCATATLLLDACARPVSPVRTALCSKPAAIAVDR